MSLEVNINIHTDREQVKRGQRLKKCNAMAAIFPTCKCFLILVFFYSIITHSLQATFCKNTHELC